MAGATVTSSLYGEKLFSAGRQEGRLAGRLAGLVLTVVLYSTQCLQTLRPRIQLYPDSL